MDETRENMQDASLKDTAPQETPSVDTSGITPKTETKTYTEEELTKQINDALSAKGRDAKRLTDWEASLASQQNQFQERAMQQRIEMRQKEIDALVEDPDSQGKARYRHKLEDDVRVLEEQKELEKTAVTKMFNQAKDLIKQYKLSPDVITDLLDAESRREMELMAQVKAAEQEKLATKTPKESGIKPDSGISDAGADSDEAFQKAWNSGELKPTKENLARAEKIINK